MGRAVFIGFKWVLSAGLHQGHFISTKFGDLTSKPMLFIQSHAASDDETTVGSDQRFEGEVPALQADGEAQSCVLHPALRPCLSLISCQY